MLLIFSLQLLQNQREMEEMKKSWQERLAEQEAANKVGHVYPFHHQLACVASVASVSVRFRCKERGTRVKNRAENGAAKTENPVLGFSLLRNQTETLATEANHKFYLEIRKKLGWSSLKYICSLLALDK